MTKAVTPDLPPSGAFGLLFRAARQDAGMTLDAVANALHLDVAVIAAIEEGRFAALPMRPYARGYVRNYARLLGLDADDLAARFDAADTGRPEPGIVVPRRLVARNAELALRPLALGYAAIVVVLLIALGAVLWMAWRAQDWQFPFFAVDSPEPAPLAPAPSLVVPEPVGPPDVSPWPAAPDAVPAAERGDGEADPTGADLAPGPDSAAASEAGAELVPATEQALSADAASAPDAPPQATAPVEELETPADATATSLEVDQADTPLREDEIGRDDAASSTASEATAQSRESDMATMSSGTPGDLADPDWTGLDDPTTATARGALTLVFYEESWVSVDDATGKMLFGDLGRSGRTVTVAGAVPLSVLVGNAPAVRVEFDGELVDLEPHTQDNNVARLELGN